MMTQLFKAWNSTIAKIHKTPSKIIFQVAHAGPKTSPLFTEGQLPLAPSAFSPNVRQISSTEIDEVIHAFVKYAIQLKSIDADGIQLHAAHGSLLSSFLSPAQNHQSDSSGKDRTLIISQIATEIRNAVGSNVLLASCSLPGTKKIPASSGN
jgi:2,4-dienoyl-CoA reductase-like NADH-dependent reductase (Old Yellow Enzyme family)